MHFLRDVPIRQKLARIVQLALAVALGMGTAVLLVVEFQMYRSVMTNEMRSMADVIGMSSRAALAFLDPAAGERTLAALSADPRITAARLYTKEGQRFATYRRGDFNPDLIPTTPPSDGLSLRMMSLTFVQPIRLDDERIGTIYLQFDMAPLWDFLLKHALVVMAVLGATSLVALVLSSRLQAIISGPVAHLAQMVKTVTEKYDYSVRAIKSGHDELGLLTDGFNEMLARIQERDTALEKARGELEERVNLRTQELQLEIAERKQTEAALKESEEKYRTLVEVSQDAIFVNHNNRIIYANPATLKLLGAERPEQIVGKSPFDFVHPHYHEVVHNRIQSILGKGTPVPALEEQYVRLDGTVIDVDCAATPLTYKDGRAIQVVARDITERKRAEADLALAHAELQHQTAALRLEVKERTRAEQEARDSREQLRALTSHLQSVREDERTNVAREIHDELGQMLTGIKIDVSWVAGRLSADQDALRTKIRTIGTLIDATIQSVRRIASALRPGLLDDLGLIAAIEWQVQEFQSRTGTPTRLTAEPSEIEPDRECSTAIFRILQEALTNVIRHAEATAVHITLKADAARLIMEVIDNGKGIAQHALADRHSLGLLGMRERALALGGTVAFRGRPGQGTTVTVVMPLKHPAGVQPAG